MRANSYEMGRRAEPELIMKCALMMKDKNTDEIAELMKNPVFRMVARQYERDRQNREKYGRAFNGLRVNNVKQGDLC